ncbi:MAG: hypothetical protein L3J43_09180 [Sulfurovum sp.]|nr:hypothetical protein [Sulfurovum sp.]
MPKQITLQDIKSIPHDTLADLVYMQIDDNDTLYDKVEKLLLKGDPIAVLKSINKDIASIKRGRKFIDYHASFEFADRVENIVDDIDMLITDEKEAAFLYKELILTDANVHARADDSSGSIQMAYGRAQEGWHGCLGVLSEEEIYSDIMQMLVCEGFGLRDVYSEEVPASVLTRIYNETYAKLENVSIEDFEYSDEIQSMKMCAHYLKSPTLYIKASELESKEWREHNIIDFAKEYKYADDAQGVVDMLAHITSIDNYRANDFYELQIWAYEVLGKQMDVTLAYKYWYESTKSPEILKKYLDRLEGVMREKVKQEALQDAKKLSFASALYFFYSLDEVDMAGEYIEERQHNLETGYIYKDELKKLANWLKTSYPQEAILLYRDSCERSLATTQSKNYPSAIKALKACVKIEVDNDTLSWYIMDNMAYMETLINTHKRKSKFVELFFKAFGEV